MQTPMEIRGAQELGLMQAMDAYDWRYTNGYNVKHMQCWELLLTGGKVIQIMAPLEGAAKIQAASEAAGDDALFMIGADGKWTN